MSEKGAQLGKAYVQIIPSAEGISGSISNILGGEASAAGQSAGQSVGASLISTLKSVVVAAGVGKIIKEALFAGGDLQQSFGGLDTIYGEAAQAAKDYSAEAVKAGISANDYAEQAVSFGAALKQAYSGDVVKAAEAANTAIMDMADNSAKMGTDITAVQNAYQGFAKQNYTMLDNLKLGYGGTKSEMERLLADAQKLSGVEYNIDNLGDVYDAIHVIQEDLGLTGVAAAEASETFTGSFAAMKAAGENLLANLALGEDIGPSLSVLSETIQNFIGNNLMPMLGNIFTALPDMVSQGTEFLLTFVSGIAESAPSVIPEIVNTVLDLFEASMSSTGSIMDAGISLLQGLFDGIMAAGGIFMERAPELLMTLSDSITANSQTVLDTGLQMLQPMLDGITASLPGLLSAGIEIITNITAGILDAIPGLISTAGEIVTNLAEFIIDNLPTILEAGVELFMSLVEGFMDSLPEIAGAATKVILELVASLVKNLPQLLAAGGKLLLEISTGIIQMLPKMVETAYKIASSIGDEIIGFDWLGLGADVINGIIQGVKDMGEAFIEAIVSLCSGALDAVKKFFGISSPSKVMAEEVGRYIPEGIAAGIEKYSGSVTDAMDDLKTDALTTAASMNISTSSGFVASNDGAVLARMDLMLALMSRYFPELEKSLPEGYGINVVNRQLGNALI